MPSKLFSLVCLRHRKKRVRKAKRERKCGNIGGLSKKEKTHTKREREGKRKRK
jgi:hypothetical protein